jgi:hypothetical protein
MSFLRDQNILYTNPAGVDLTLSNHILRFVNGTEESQAIDYRTIQTASGAVAAVPETLQISTYTPVTISNDTEYSVRIRQKLSTGVIIDEVFSYITPASGATAITICNNLRTQVAASNLSVTLNADGNATMVVTAVAGAAIFTTQNIAPTDSTFPDGALATVVGFYPVGQGADLITEGVTGAVSGRSYTRYDFEYLHVGNKQLTSTPEFNRLRVYADDAALGYPNFRDEMGEMASATTPAAAADPEAIAIA